MTTDISRVAPAGGRLRWIDAARGAGIALVVAGHVLGALVTSGLVARDGFAQAQVDFLYAFHMPLFFVLSGLLAPRASRGRLPGAVAAKARTLLWPYLLWSGLLIALHAAASPVANHPVAAGAILQVAWQPVQHLWFLYVLLLLSLGWTLLTAAGLRPLALLAAATVAHFLPGRADLGAWGSGYLIATHAVWFAAGATAGAGAATEFARRVPRPVAASLLLLAAVAVASTAGWTTAPPGNLPSDLAALAAAMAGATAVILLASRAASAAEPGMAVQALVALGRSSLAIYLLHPLVAAAVRVLLLRTAGLREPALHFAVETALGLLLPLAIERAALVSGAAWLFRWPSRRAPGARVSAAVSVAQGV